MGEASRISAWELLGEIVAISLGAFVVSAVAIWLIVQIKSRYCDNEDPKVAEHEMLVEIRELHRQGDLSEQEYRSIKNQLIQRIGDPRRGPKIGRASCRERV